MSRRALTLLEILIALVILAVIMAGLTNLFISGKRWMLHARARMAGGEIGKEFLDPLQMQVRQDNWSTNCLGSYNGADCATFLNPWPDPSTQGRVVYSPHYTNIAAVNPESPNHTLGHLRKVVLNVTWPEIDPNEP
jgi:prepilin-type N-terminal cleavage/methylation domain-containing protein